MTIFEAILMGLVQGLGEFLPISSSGHLILVPWLLEFKDPGQTFDIALHFGTLLAVLVYFGKDWLDLGKGAAFYLCGKEKLENKKYFNEVFNLALATVPAALVGLLFEDFIEEHFRNPLLVAIDLIVMGAILFWVDRKSVARQSAQVCLKHAIIIGLAQALALFPGVSRSGATITAALFLGYDRSQAARFSFMLSTPIILGACLLKMKYIPVMIADPINLLSITVSAISGFLSIKYLIKLIKNYSYKSFSYYRFIFGTVVIIVYLYRS